MAAGCLLAALAGLGLVGRVDIRLFHALAELTCAVAGTATFLVVWNARSFVENGFFPILGLAFLAAAGFDAMGLLARGETFPPLLGWATSEQLWTAGGLALSVTLCAGAWLPDRFSSAATAVGTAAACLAVAATFSPWLFFPIGPLADATGPALAAATRIAPPALFALAGLGLWRNRDRISPPIVRLLEGSLACLALSGLIWPRGDDPGFWPEILGHEIKILGYFLSYQAIAVTGIRRPHALLFQEIGQREQELTARMTRLHAQARAVFDLNRQETLEAGDFRNFAAMLLMRAMAVLGVARGGVWVFSPARDRLYCLLGAGAAREDEGAELAAADFPLYFQAVERERVILAGEASPSPPSPNLAANYLAPRGITALLGAPFRFSGRVSGVLCLEHAGSPRRFSDDEQAFAGSMADVLSLALETAERRRANRELAESEHRLRTLIDAMPDPVCFKDATGRWQTANQAQIEAYGLAGLDWMGRTDAELAGMSQGDTQAFAVAAATDGRAWETREPSVFGMSLAPPGGEPRHFDVIKTPLFHEDGRPKGLLILSRDITAYREALARLRESNDELEAIYNETSDGLIIADAGSRAIVRVNAAACRMFGHPAARLAGLSLWDLHPGEDREWSLTLFGEIAVGRMHLLEGIPCLRADGTVFYADISAQPITYAGRPGILGFYRDVSGRRAIEEALKASEDRFRKIFNSTYDAIFLHDVNGTILDVNDKMLELYGVRRDEAASFSLQNDYSSLDNPLEYLAEYWRDVLAGEERFFEWKARRPHDGSMFYVEVYLRRVTLAETHVILANVRDITERKRVLAALAARQEEISALNRDLARRVHEETEKNRQKDLLLLHQTRLAAMGEMIGNIAHQWRQPLNALSILLANMRFEYEGVCEETGALETSHRQAGEILRKMSATIDDFRNFFRPDKQPAVFSVVQAIGDALLLIEASLAQHGVTIRFTARHDPRVMGFRGEFSQVILNLLSNAKDAILEHRPDGGLIAIRVRIHRGQAVVLLRDNGGGIAPDLAQRIFDPYFTTKGPKGGTGLGLYMSNMIIKDHMRGDIRAINVREGALFAIRIPLGGPKDPSPEDRA